MAIYLIRHGQSEGNVNGYYQGSLDVPLTDLGRMQASRLGRWLNSLNIKPEKIYTSPLKRAHQTAKIIAAQLMASSPVVRDELREYYAGELEGKTQAEINSQFPGYADRTLDERGDFSLYGGESYEKINSRLAVFIDSIHKDHTFEDDVLVVSHGGALYQLLKQWCSWPTPRHVFNHISNCCCYRLGLRIISDVQVAELQWMIPIDLLDASLVSANDGAVNSAEIME